MKDQSKDYKIKAQIIKNDKVEEVELRVVASGEIVFFYKKNTLVEISKLPSKEELIGRLIGSMNSPVYKFVNTLNQSKSKIVYVLNSIANQKNN